MVFFLPPKSLPKGHPLWKKRPKPCCSRGEFLMFFPTMDKDMQENSRTIPQEAINKKKKKQENSGVLFSYGFIVGRKVHKAHGRNKIKRRLRNLMGVLFREILAEEGPSLDFLKQKTCGFVFLIKNKTFLDIPYDALKDILLKSCKAALRHESHQGPGKNFHSKDKKGHEEEKPPTKKIVIPMSFLNDSCENPQNTLEREKNPLCCHENFPKEKKVFLTSQWPMLNTGSKKTGIVHNSFHYLVYGLGLFFFGLYRCGVAPFLSGSCRFSPSCSVYALNLLRKKPLYSALGLIVKRLAKCHPWTKEEL